MRDSQRRSLMKAISWRIFGTIVTIIIAMAATGEMKLAAGIGLADFFGKSAIYYLHERLWNRIRFGEEKPPDYTI